MNDKVDDIFKKNEKKVRKKMKKKKADNEKQEKINIHDATFDYMNQENLE